MSALNTYEMAASLARCLEELSKGLEGHTPTAAELDEIRFAVSNAATVARDLESRLRVDSGDARVGG